MKKILIGILSFLLCSCIEDSVLSDMELTDPSLIKPMIEINKESYAGGSTSESILVYLHDKNGDFIDLKTGKVTVNDKQMDVKTYVISDGAKFYSGIEKIGRIKFPEEYSFGITLSDNKSYYSNIITQNTELTSLSCVDTHDKNNDLKVTWNKLDKIYDLDLQLSVFFSNDSSGGTKVYSIESINNSPDNNSFNISRSYFSYTDNIVYKVRVELISWCQGVVDSRFMAGSKLRSKNSISREVEIIGN